MGTGGSAGCYLVDLKGAAFREVALIGESTRARERHQRKVEALCCWSATFYIGIV
jgi:hypothetical protein